jgi:hypothetical protein
MVDNQDWLTLGSACSSVGVGLLAVRFKKRLYITAAAVTVLLRHVTNE